MYGKLFGKNSASHCQCFNDEMECSVLTMQDNIGLRLYFLLTFFHSHEVSSCANRTALCGTAFFSVLPVFPDTLPRPMCVVQMVRFVNEEPTFIARISRCITPPCVTHIKFKQLHIQ